MSEVTKWRCVVEPSVQFWVEAIEEGMGVLFHVVCQFDGYPATEAFDDWFATREDAEAIAKLLAEGREL